MKVLLDTHALLWALSGDERMSAKAVKYYQDAEHLYFSMVSLWEIGIKLALNRPDFQLDQNWWQTIPQALLRQGVNRLDIEPQHCRDVALLPLRHRDPFDRLLIVQAAAIKASLLSNDTQLDAYKIKRIW